MLEFVYVSVALAVVLGLATWLALLFLRRKRGMAATLRDLVRLAADFFSALF